MSIATQDNSKDMDWDGVVQQIFDMIGTDTAVINRYGIVLASRIPGFDKGRLLSPMLFDVITKRDKLKRELEVNEITSLVLETDQGNIIYTFGQFIYLMSKVPKTVDLAQFMPSINRIILTLDKSTDKTLTLNFESLKLEEEFQELRHDSQSDSEEDHFPIFKHLIKHMARKS